MLATLVLSLPTSLGMLGQMKVWRIILPLCALLWSSFDSFALRFVVAPKPCTGDFLAEVSRARYYNPQTGRFWTMDAFGGRQVDPISLHKYLYAHANPINRIDPSGQMDLPQLGITMTVGAAMGATSAYYANHALGRAQTFSSILMGASVGAVAGPLAVEYAWFGVGVGAVSVASSGAIVWDVFSNPDSSYLQRVEASALLVASVWGSQVATKYAYAARMKPVETASMQPTTKRLFRCITEKEIKQIRESSTGEFEYAGGSTPDGLPGKWFYGTRADAEAFAALHANEHPTIVATEVTESTIASIKPGIDGNRTGYFVHMEDLISPIDWLPYP